MTSEIEILRANQEQVEPLFESIEFKFLEDSDGDEQRDLVKT